MSKRRYKFAPMTDEQMTELAKLFPRAVETETITRRRLNYSVVSRLIDCGVTVPGVSIVEGPEQTGLPTADVSGLEAAGLSTPRVMPRGFA